MATATPGQMINELAPGPFKTLAKINPIGALQARKQANGSVSLFWRYSLGQDSQRVPIGIYDSSAPPSSVTPSKKGLSIQAAIRASEVLAKKHHDNRAVGGHRGLIEVEAEAIRKVEAVKLEAAQYTLKNMLTHYCDHLEGLGRRSHKDARSIFKIHVYDAWPKIAVLPANQVTGEQVADMMRRVLESGKGRTANKLRSYIRAAYQVALAARSKASVPLHFKAYRVTSNPGADTVPDEAENRADKNPLTAVELRRYWQTIKLMSGFKGAILRLQLLSGGQRIEQLVNLKTANVTVDSIQLYDGKGRPGKAPRPHTVPLIPLAAAALVECNPQSVYALSTDNGVTHLAATTLSTWAVEAAVNIPGFATKRIRSGVETLLASARISTEIRGRLQSHGITGVQARHYDGHDYMDEKRHALETLFTLLDESEATSNVAQIKVT